MRTIRPALAEQLATRIREYRDTSPAPFNHQRIVAELGVLPLTCDWAGCHALRPDGVIIVFQTEYPDDWRIEEDPRLQNMAIFQGSLKYPELKELVPSKPANAQPCKECGRTGIHPINAQIEVKCILCYCGGLGWTP